MNDLIKVAKAEFFSDLKELLKKHKAAIYAQSKYGCGDINDFTLEVELQPETVPGSTYDRIVYMDVGGVLDDKNCEEKQ